jgi:hypothetical protein
LARSEIDRATTEFVDEHWTCRTAEQPGMTVRKGQYCPIFGYYGVNELKISRYLFQVRKNATGHEDDYDSACTCLRDGSPDVRINYSIARDRTIVIERQYTELQ